VTFVALRQGFRWVVALATLGAIAGCAGNTAPLSARFAAGDEVVVCTGADLTHPGTTLTLVDAADGRVDTRLASGVVEPAAVAVGTGRHWMVVVGAGDDRLVTIDPTTGSIGRQVRVGLEPDAVAVTDHGTLALVADSGSAALDAVDLTSGHLTRAVVLSADPDAAPAAVAVGAGGTVAIVADEEQDAAVLVDLRRWQVSAVVPVGAEPDAVAVTPDGTTALVANLGADSIIPVNLAKASAGPPIRLGIDPTGLAVTTAPMPGTSRATDPIGTAWVSGGDALVPVDLRSMTVGTPLPTGGPAEAVALADHGRRAWVADADGAVAEVDLVTGRLQRLVHVGGHPTAVAIPSR